MEAIYTKYLGPTDTRGSRVRATTASGGKDETLTRSWDSAGESTDNHVAAARELATKLGWKGDWVHGYATGGEYVFVCCGRHVAFTVT